MINAIPSSTVVSLFLMLRLRFMRLAYSAFAISPGLWISSNLRSSGWGCLWCASIITRLNASKSVFIAEFETARQHFIRAFHIRKPRRAEAFVNRARDRGHIPKATSDSVRVVRGNVLVHERSTPVNPVTIREATRFLYTFLSRLQRIW
jgi:hypothetical protein